MPYIHHYPVRVRHYECDADGGLHPAALLGYLQEAAFAGSAAVGYSAARYAQIGLQWLAYETELALADPAGLRPGYDDALLIRTWVVDFRRVRSLRRYEVLWENSGDLFAHASTDWVLIDLAARAPASIPPEIVTAYAAGEPVDPAPPRPPFPRFPPVPDDAMRTQRRVEWRDIDPAGHVNNAVYLHYAAEAERLALADAGVARAAVATRAWQIEYKLAALLDDVIELATWVETPTEAEAGAPQVRRTIMTRAADGKTLARIRSEFTIRL